MPKFANQQTVRIDKPTQKTNFALYDKDDLATACEVLNPSALRVWLYLLSNSDQVKWDVSPQHALSTWGIPKNSFHDGWKELVQKGFYDPTTKTLHARSPRAVNEIRRKKRNSETNEIRTDQTKLANPDEIQYSNRINTTKSNLEKTVDADASTNNISVGNRTSAIPSVPTVEEFVISKEHLIRQAGVPSFKF